MRPTTRLVPLLAILTCLAEFLGAGASTPPPPASATSARTVGESTGGDATPAAVRATSTAAAVTDPAARETSTAAAATDPAVADPATPGALQVTRGDGTVVDMPLRHTGVRVEISAFVARTVVEQVFLNPFDDPVEAVYTFPLGHGAAVNDFEMRVGDRTIRGEIHRREEARRIYETARAQGYRAALLEQERPNIFTQNVANLEPGVEIRVRLQTVEVVPYEAGVYQYTFPLVVGPRYVPGGAAGVAPDGTTTTPVAPTPDVPDAPAITPPVLRPGMRSGHDVSIEVVLDAGVPVRSVASPSHRIESRLERGTARVVLAGDDRIPNKDFVLRWDVSAETPEIALLAHRSGIDGFFTLLVQPKGEVAADEAMPKEIVLVLDTSGSMRGYPLELSRSFLRQALRGLGPRDTFNLVRFAGASEVFSEGSLANTPANVDRALRWVEDLQGSGGTEMLSAFRSLAERPVDPERLRIVVFLTDGFIGNEHQILEAVRGSVGETRIFTLGMGSSVNHYLLAGMAEIGRGAYTFIPRTDDASRAVDRFRGWVTRPYLTDLEIDWGSLPVLDMVPDRVLDLYSGQTLSVVGRYAGGAQGRVTVRGRLAGRPWERSVAVALPEREEDHAALASIWARHRVRELLLSHAGSVPEAVRAEVVALGLEFRLMTPFTSFVAVDDSVVVNPDGSPRQVRQALPLPEGVSFDGVFGSDGPPCLLEKDEVEIALPGDEDSVNAHPDEDVAPRLRSLGYVGGRAAGEVAAAEEMRSGPARMQAAQAPPPGSADRRRTVYSEKKAGISVRPYPLPAPSLADERLDEPAGSGSIVAGAVSVEYLTERALRVLADLSDDGTLSPSDGRPALAALLAGQTAGGQSARSADLQALVTWALAEASSDAPDDPWLRQACEESVEALARALREDEAGDAGFAATVLRIVRTGRATSSDRSQLRAGLEALAPASGPRTPGGRLAGSLGYGGLNLAG